MQYFRYKALRSDGTLLESHGQGESRVEVLAQLKSQGLTVVRLEPTVARRTGIPKVNGAFISRFYGMLGNQLQVGVPMLTALSVVASQERSVSGKQLVSEVAKSVESGKSLSHALEGQGDSFSAVDLHLIRAGEEGGFLPAAIERIAQMRQWQEKLISGAWGAAAYPLVLITLALLLVPAMLIYLVPKLEPIFDSLRRDSQLPFATGLLLSASRACQQYGMVTLAASALLLSLAYVALPKDRVRAIRDGVILRVPLIGSLVRDFILARFFRILGTLLQNKIQIQHALKIAVNVLGNQDLQRAFEPLHELVSSGNRLADSFSKTQQIPADVLAMIGVAEQSNSLDEVLIKIAEQLEYRTNRRLEIVVKLIEPLLLLIMAVFVGFVVMALLLPIFEGQTLG